MSTMSFLQYRPQSASPPNNMNKYRSTLYGSRDYSSSKYAPSSYSNNSNYSSNYYNRPSQNPLYQSTSFINNKPYQPSYQQSNYSQQNNALLQTVKDFSRDLDDLFYERKNSYTKRNHTTQFQTPKKASYDWESKYDQLQSTGASSSLYNSQSQKKLNTLSPKSQLTGNFITDLFSTPKQRKPVNDYFDDYYEMENDLNQTYNNNNYQPSKSLYSTQNNFYTSKVTSPIREQTSYGVLPANRSGKKYTLVLDMDETLTHTLNSFSSKVKFLVRPGCEQFLREMSQYFEIVVFTAAMQEYADEILDQIDPLGYISHRLYRQHLQVYRGEYIKDLSVLGRDLSKTLIIDNLRSNFAAQPNNGFEISEFRGQSYDTALSRLSMSLKRMVENDVSDVRMYPIRG